MFWHGMPAVQVVALLCTTRSTPLLIFELSFDCVSQHSWLTWLLGEFLGRLVQCCVRDCLPGWAILSDERESCLRTHTGLCFQAFLNACRARFSAQVSHVDLEASPCRWGRIRTPGQVTEGGSFIGHPNAKSAVWRKWLPLERWRLCCGMKWQAMLPTKENGKRQQGACSMWEFCKCSCEKSWVRWAIWHWEWQ